MHLLKRERGAQQVLRKVLASGDVVRGDGFGAVIDVETAVPPGQEVGEFGGADELGLAQGVEEAVAEKFGDRGGAFRRHAVEAALFVEEPVGGQDVKVRVEDQVIAEGMDGGGGGDTVPRLRDRGGRGRRRGGFRWRCGRAG